ncbi:OmpA family protein [Sodalis sp. RH15]|uniref:OmpA family protein n=1 Tax=Sodalis sp. RH15 TaxID=3394330 RepID=UPI0039B4A7F1
MPIMTVRMKRGLWLLIGGLTLMLCLGVLPWGMTARFFSGALTLSAVAGAWIICGRKAFPVSAEYQHLLAALPGECSTPIVLVCGDSDDLDRLFGPALVREIPHGCYLRLGAAKELARLTPVLLAQRPAWRRQLAAMFFLSPQSHTDQGVLRTILRGWHHELAGMSRNIGHRPPAMICLFLNGKDGPWYFCPTEGALGIIGELAASGQETEDGLSIKSGGEPIHHLPQIIEAQALLAWYRDTLMAEKPADKYGCPPRVQSDLAVRFTSMPVLSGNVWQRHLAARTLLRPVSFSSAREISLPFPDPLLWMLPRPQGPTACRRAMAWGMAVLTGYCLAALCIVAWNNQRLLIRVAADLQRYHNIPPSAHGPKASALTVLVNDAKELELYHRQGTPLRLGLGLYSGTSLYAGLLAAIDGYMPPLFVSDAPQPHAPGPQTLNLNSLSLFNAGSASLKPEATKVLVAALMDIKAQPGWLIVVAGHTDDTGSHRRNQDLSLARAEAVRDWLRTMGNIPSGCFAVQGHGSARPIAGNDTVAGRAANRRVDIRLIPEPGACQPVAGIQAPPLRQ